MYSGIAEIGSTSGRPRKFLECRISHNQHRAERTNCPREEATCRVQIAIDKQVIAARLRAEATRAGMHDQQKLAEEAEQEQVEPIVAMSNKEVPEVAEALAELKKGEVDDVAIKELQKLATDLAKLKEEEMELEDAILQQNFAVAFAKWPKNSAERSQPISISEDSTDDEKAPKTAVTTTEKGDTAAADDTAAWAAEEEFNEAWVAWKLAMEKASSTTGPEQTDGIREVAKAWSWMKRKAFNANEGERIAQAEQVAARNAAAASILGISLPKDPPVANRDAVKRRKKNEESAPPAPAVKGKGFGEGKCSRDTCVRKASKRFSFH